MKKKVLLAVPLGLRDEKIFSDGHRDDTFERFRLLRDYLKDEGVELTTELKEPFTSYIAAIFPFGSNSSYSSELDIPHKILILTESKYISPSSYLNSFHEKFDYVYTWDTDICKKENYERLFYSSSLTARFDPLKVRESLAVSVFSNKKARGVNVPGDLYEARIDIIKYASKTNVDFDLYGMGWDEYYFGGNKYMRYFNALPLAKSFMNIFYKPPKCYRGAIENKKKILQKYNFNICPENFCAQRGYITEKIWDSLVSGAVPVYQGPEDIGDILPGELFIDLGGFSSPAEMFGFLKDFSESELLAKRKIIFNFLKDNAEGEFSSIYFAKKIRDKVIGQLRFL